MTCNASFRINVAAVVALVSLLAGCENQAHKFLGSQAVTVLQAPTRIEGWRYQYDEGAHEPKGTTAVKELNTAYANRLAKILLDSGTYSFDSASHFSPVVSGCGGGGDFGAAGIHFTRACRAAFNVGGNVVMSALCWCITRSSPIPTPRTHTGWSV